MPVLIDLPDLDNRDIVTFTYSASDPGNVTRAGSDATGYTYSPALGAMRLWAKDGPQSRKVGKIGECGDYGDWIAPGVEYSGSVIASALTQVSAGIYRAFLENVAGVDVTQIGVQRQTRTTGPATAASKTSGADLSLHTDWGSDRYIPEAIWGRPYVATQLDLAYPAGLPDGTILTLAVNADPSTHEPYVRVWSEDPNESSEAVVLIGPEPSQGSSMQWTKRQNMPLPTCVWVQGMRRSPLLGADFTLTITPPAPAGHAAVPGAVETHATVGAKPLIQGFYGMVPPWPWNIGGLGAQNLAFGSLGASVATALGDQAAVKMYDRKKWEVAFAQLQATLDTNSDGRYDPTGYWSNGGKVYHRGGIPGHPPDVRRSIRFFGYSNGGHVSMVLSQKMASGQKFFTSGQMGDFRIVDLVALVNPVPNPDQLFGTFDAGVGNNVRVLWNRYQTKGPGAGLPHGRHVNGGSLDGGTDQLDLNPSGVKSDTLKFPIQGYELGRPYEINHNTIIGMVGTELIDLLLDRKHNP